MSTYYIPGTISGFKDLVMNKQTKMLVLWSLHYCISVSQPYQVYYCLYFPYKEREALKVFMTAWGYTKPGFETSVLWNNYVMLSKLSLFGDQWRRTIILNASNSSYHKSHWNSNIILSILKLCMKFWEFTKFWEFWE